MADTLQIELNDEDLAWWEEEEEVGRPLPLLLRPAEVPQREEREETVREGESEERRVRGPPQRPRKVRPQVHRVVSAETHQRLEAAMKASVGLRCSRCERVSAGRKAHARHVQSHFCRWVCGCSRQRVFDLWEGLEEHRSATCPGVAFMVSVDRLAAFCAQD